MICVTSKVLSARSADRPTAIDLVEIAVAPGLKFIGLLGGKLAALIFDNEGSLLDRRRRKKAQARAGTSDTESSLAGHVRQYDDSRPCDHMGRKRDWQLLSLILRRLDAIERKLDHMLEELRTPHGHWLFGTPWQFSRKD